MRRLATIFILLELLGCHSAPNTKYPISNNAHDCSWLNKNKKPIEQLLQNQYAHSLSDSFLVFMYATNYRMKMKKEHSDDSISFLRLRIQPYIIATSEEDSSTIGLLYAFTDEHCTRYYDDLLKSPSEPIIAGMRFSIADKKLKCFELANGRLLLDSRYKHVNEVIRSKDFLQELNQQDSLTNHLKDLIKSYQK